jgi:MFS family permease
MKSSTPTAERGFYGWPLLVFLWIVYTIPVGFAFYSLPVLFPFMIEETGWSRGQVMVGFTAVVLTLGLTAPLTAWMLRRFGGRVTMFIGGIIIAVSTFLIGLVGHIYPLYVAIAVVVGLGVSFASILPAQTVIITWFNTKRALALGLVLGGGGIGGFIAPWFINWAVLNADGTSQIGWFIIAIACLIGGVIAILTVRNRPQDMGQHVDGIKPDTSEAAAGDSRKKLRTYRTTMKWTVGDALKTPAFWFLVVAVATSFFTWQIILTQGPLHLQDRGFDPATAAFLYSLAIGLSIVGRFAIAGVGDIIEPRYLYAFGALCILLGGILFWFVTPEAIWITYLYPLLAGLGFGLCYVCVPTLIGNYWGIEVFAAVSGILAPISLVAQAIAGPVAGFLYDIQGSYLTILVVSWVGGAAGFVAMLFCRPPKPPEKEIV